MPTQYMKDNTYTVVLEHKLNGLTISVDVISTGRLEAETFARRRFKLDRDSWEYVNVDKKYRNGVADPIEKR